MTSAKFREEFDKYDPIDVEGVVVEHKKWIAERMRRHRSTMWINLASLCLSLLLIMSTFIPLRNLLSTMYPYNGLGYFSLCCIYATYVIGCYALSTIAHYIHPKGAIVLAIIGHSIFAGSHLYPSFETLIPASCVLGLCQAVLWRSQELLCTSYAANYAALSGANVNQVLKRFHTALILSVQLAQILGNSLVSVIFFQHDSLHAARGIDRQNTTLTFTAAAEDSAAVFDLTNRAVRDISYLPSESLSIQQFHRPFVQSQPYDAMHVDYCPKDPQRIVDKYTVEFHTVKIIFLSFTITALVVVSVFLHKPDILVQRRNLDFKQQLHDIFHVWGEKRWLLTTGVMFYSGIQQALIVGELTKVKWLFKNIFVLPFIFIAVKLDSRVTILDRNHFSKRGCLEKCVVGEGEAVYNNTRLLKARLFPGASICWKWSCLKECSFGEREAVYNNVHLLKASRWQLCTFVESESVYECQLVEREAIYVSVSLLKAKLFKKASVLSKWGCLQKGPSVGSEAVDIRVHLLKTRQFTWVPICWKQSW